MSCQDYQDEPSGSVAKKYTTSDKYCGLSVSLSRLLDGVTILKRLPKGRPVKPRAAIEGARTLRD